MNNILNTSTIDNTNQRQIIAVEQLKLTEGKEFFRIASANQIITVDMGRFGSDMSIDLDKDQLLALQTFINKHIEKWEI